MESTPSDEWSLYSAVALSSTINWFTSKLASRKIPTSCPMRTVASRITLFAYLTRGKAMRWWGNSSVKLLTIVEPMMVKQDWKLRLQSLKLLPLKLAIVIHDICSPQLSTEQCRPSIAACVQLPGPSAYRQFAPLRCEHLQLPTRQKRISDLPFVLQLRNFQQWLLCNRELLHQLRPESMILKSKISQAIFIILQLRPTLRYVSP